MTALRQILSLPEAAALLDLSEERVLVFCRQGRILARKLKREWVLSRASVLAFRRKARPGGRPKVDPRQRSQ